MVKKKNKNQNNPVVLLTDCRAYSYVSARIPFEFEFSLLTFVSAKYCILFSSISQKPG